MINEKSVLHLRKFSRGGEAEKSENGHQTMVTESESPGRFSKRCPEADMVRKEIHCKVTGVLPGHISTARWDVGVSSQGGGGSAFSLR
jgi:hypothetical protein